MKRVSTLNARAKASPKKEKATARPARRKSGRFPVKWIGAIVFSSIVFVAWIAWRSTSDTSRNMTLVQRMDSIKEESPDAEVFEPANASPPKRTMGHSKKSSEPLTLPSTEESLSEEEMNRSPKKKAF